MENASKALIMAASVILGIMIITFSVFIFGIFKDYNAKNTSQIEEKEDSRFNSEFFKYYENGKDVLKVTPHDIVSIANFAKENNLFVTIGSDFHNKDGLRPEIGFINTDFILEPKENSYYVTIDVLTKNEKIYNFEKKSQDEYTSFIEQNKIFKCSEIRVNKITKRVEYVKYEEI